MGNLPFTFYSLKGRLRNTSIWYHAFRRAYYSAVKKEDDVLLSLPQVADALDVSHVTAWRIVVQEKLLPAVKVGQNWAVWKSAVDAYKADPPKRPSAGRPRKHP